MILVEPLRLIAEGSDLELLLELLLLKMLAFLVRRETQTVGYDENI